MFQVYGNRIDPKTNTPLFSKKSWNKAKNVLLDILAGYVSDPPGVAMYTIRLNRFGAPKIDANGIRLIKCTRGTNMTEDFHKQVIECFGGWWTGAEMADCLLDIRRGRWNQDMAVQGRAGHPNLGMYDVWLIDELQLLVERNHGVMLFPEWSNASDYVTTPERFGTVCLHSEDLDLAVRNIQVPDEWKKRLTEEHRYLCKVMDTQLPFLPVVSEAECLLFARLILQMNPIGNWEQMAIHWCSFVKVESDSNKSIFPKLPVYLKTHYRKYQQSQRVKEAVKHACTGEEKLKDINAETLTTYASNAVGAAGQSVPRTHTEPRGVEGGEGASCEGELLSFLPVPSHVPVMMPPVMRPAPGGMSRTPMLVDGTMIGSCLNPLGTDWEATLKKRRGKDLRARAQRACRRCMYLGEHFDVASKCDVFKKRRSTPRECKHPCPTCSKKTSCDCKYSRPTAGT